MSSEIPLTKLPFDVFEIIFNSLEARDFLAFCSTCKELYANRHDSGYWRQTTQTTFRVRNRPTVEEDGVLWQKLYRRLRTQTHVYTWGQNSYNCMALSPPDSLKGNLYGQSWPQDVEEVREEDYGIVADLQCGGWSTAFLNNRGELYLAGVLDGESQHGFMRGFGRRNHHQREPGISTTETVMGGYRTFVQLALGVLHEHENKHRENHFTIKEFSLGRSHILGLSDDGTMWCWSRRDHPGIPLLFLGEDDAKRATPAFYVVAGWDKSSAYIRGRGIFTWAIVSNDQGKPSENIMQTSEYSFVSGTEYQRPLNKTRGAKLDSKDDDDGPGEVKNHIILEGYVVFVTDLGKVFSSRIGKSHTFELYDLEERSSLDRSPAAVDVQGSFRSFAVFKSNGEVITTTQDYLEFCENEAEGRRDIDLEKPELLRIPALQNTGVISMAFGDYHYHALHSDGRITSYGKDAQGNGMLALGPSRLRGLEPGGAFSSDLRLLPHTYVRGRNVWFQTEKLYWLQHLDDAAPHNAQNHLIDFSPEVLGELSEWIEQAGSDWDKEPEVAEKDEDGLGAHFALSVAAGGWHSGALVLVNDDLVNVVSKRSLDTSLGITSLLPLAKKYKWESKGFPRVRLESGATSDSGPFEEWKKEPPRWNLKYRGEGFSRRAYGIMGWEKVGD